MHIEELLISHWQQVHPWHSPARSPKIILLRASTIALTKIIFILGCFRSTLSSGQFSTKGASLCGAFHLRSEQIRKKGENTHQKETFFSEMHFRSISGLMAPRLN